jgi:cell division protein ZapA (FtsZ GTPase activity inhibitor)
MDTFLSEPEYENSHSESRPETIPQELLIDVLGTSFVITTGEDPEYLDEVLARYRAAVAYTQDISGMQDPLKVAVLTGFMICEKYNQLRLAEEKQANAEARRVAEAKEMSIITRELIARIDRVFEQTQSLLKPVSNDRNFQTEQ